MYLFTFFTPIFENVQIYHHGELLASNYKDVRKMSYFFKYD